MKTRVSCARFAASTLSILLAFPALSQTSASPQLSETVVTATRVPQPLTDVVADVSIIDRDEIERLGATTVTQILARLPGMQSNPGRVYIRGAESRMTALYIDGVRVDSQDGASLLGGGAPWDLVPVARIERIEILRGPASAVYGSDAMGGVVQIFTQRGQAGFSPYVNSGVGSLNTRRINGGFSGAQAGWDYAIGVGREASDGYNTRPDVRHTPDREPYSQNSASLRLGYQVTAAQRLEWAALENQSDSRYVPFAGGTDFISKGKLGTSALKWKSQWTDAYSTGLTLSRSRIARQNDSPADYTTTTRGILLENSLRVGRGLATAVLEQRKDDFDSKPSTYDPAFRGGRTQNAAGLGYGGVFGLHSLQVNLRSDHDSIFGTHSTGAVAYGYAFMPGWRATVSSGTAFRAPTLEQVFGPYGSARLQAETSRSNEIGIGYEHAFSSFKAVMYRNAIKNLISSSQTLATCSAGFFCYYNVGQASIRGTTLSGKHRFQDYAVRASLDILDPRDDVTGRILSLRARQVLSVGLDRRAGVWLLGGDVQAVGQRFDNAANTRVLPGYGLLNLGASREIGKDWRLVLRVDNVTAHSYEQVGNYPARGRFVFAGLNWQPQR